MGASTDRAVPGAGSVRMSPPRRQHRRVSRAAYWLGGLSLCTLMIGCGKALGATAQVPAGAEKVQVTAKNWAWVLSRTTFPVGKPIDFVVSAAQDAHGFSIVGTPISQAVVQGRPPLNVVWTPPTTGTYIIRCDLECGQGHYDMFTRIYVT